MPEIGARGGKGAKGAGGGAPHSVHRGLYNPAAYELTWEGWCRYHYIIKALEIRCYV